ncbi:hypothetical protein OUZ56_029677 [Daphnia magna]|uniref:Uncharacterized protein n=1 Tax=Daphnia magna TaxID=35525 RepID=A0ABR0B7I3_9CRUS|nr:hypothetical protein OUZ56_029677 [Daphnia magna]
MADEGGFVHECVEHPDPEICEEQRSSHLHRVTVERWPENPSICPLTTLKNSTVGIKDQLKAAGLDTSVFTAHLTRGAAASKAAASGASVQAILKQSHWARESTIARPTVKSNRKKTCWKKAIA